MRRFAALCVTLLVLPWGPGCTRRGEPSPAYAEAQEAFNALYGRHLEDAYVHPEMPAIEEKLASVPEDSSDARQAHELHKRIQSGRERLLAQRAELDKAVQQALRPTEDFAFAEEPDAGVRAPEDAGFPPVPNPVAGMPLAELRRRWPDCFLTGQAIEVPDSGVLPTMVLRETAYCKARHKGFDAKLVFIQGETVSFIGERSLVEIVEPDAGVTPSPQAPPPSQESGAATGATGTDAG